VRRRRSCKNDAIARPTRGVTRSAGREKSEKRLGNKPRTQSSNDNSNNNNIIPTARRRRAGRGAVTGRCR